MRKLIALLLVIAAAFGLVMGYVWYTFKSKVDEGIKMAAPFAEIRYGSVHVSPFGEVGLNDIVIEPKITTDKFTVEKVRVSAPNLFYFIDGSRRMSEGEIPQHLGFSLSKLKIDLNGSMFQMMSKAQDGYSASDSLLEKVEALGCGNLEGFLLEDLRRMGIEALELDLSMEMNYQKERNLLSGKVEFGERKFGKFTVDVQLDAKSHRLRNLDRNLVPKMKMKYVDKGWHTLRNSYCAQMNKGTAQEYVERNASLLKTQMGIGLSDQMTKAYKGFLLNGGDVSISINPQPETSWDAIKYYSGQDVMDMLGMEISVNGVALDKKKIDWGDGKGASEAKNRKGVADAKTSKDDDVAAAKNHKDDVAEAKSGKSSVERKNGKELAEAKKNENVEKEAPILAPAPKVSTPRPVETTKGMQGFRMVDKKEWGKHVAKLVRITFRDGRLREGRLSEIDGERVRLEMQLSAGSITLPIKIGEIKQVEFAE